MVTLCLGVFVVQLINKARFLMVEMYGISNCDTIRKARKWLTEHEIAYVFHDYKKEGVDRQKMTAWIDELGWETLLNKRGTTWRKLDDADKADVDRDKAIALLCANPSMIKRPVLVFDATIEVGFSISRYNALLR